MQEKPQEPWAVMQESVGRAQSLPGSFCGGRMAETGWFAEEWEEQVEEPLNWEVSVGTSTS